MKDIYRLLKLIILIFLSPASLSNAQQTSAHLFQEIPLIYFLHIESDTVIEKKFVLNAVNEGVASPKYKSVEINIGWNNMDKTYQAIISSKKNIHSYLEIRDWDDNVIYFKEISLVPGVNIIPLVTEDNNQNMFTFSFQSIRNATPANYVMKEYEILKSATVK